MATGAVDLHDECGGFYPTPFELPDGRLDVTSTTCSIELRGLGRQHNTYSAAGC
ncbi:hypothetical protein ACFV9C_19915 [Kribbella sp. NPDC059898]|uniref:hypothetical protein n=1 Tax=Kribbella sp. NPDC059898 TaxID=3346995 RepID=UPI00365325CC